MKWLYITILLFVSVSVDAQKDSVLIKASKSLHIFMIKNDALLSELLDDDISYGHSNGWVETKAEILNHLNTKYLVYNNITEDSVTEHISDNIGYVRFVANFDVTLNGKQLTFRLKVLEVWRKKNRLWKLFARQAIKL